MRAPRPLAALILAVLLSASYAMAKDLRISLPKKSKLTPVQKLNREGVKDIEHHQYEKAKRLFFRAYLLDPNDPFTLNNLGYISELEGDAETAQRYYSLAASFRSDAVVDQSNIRSFVGKPVDQIAGRTEDKTVNLNRINIQAMSLLQQDRAPEADLYLQKALALDPNNPFTLNNLGYAKEKEGELENALKFYSRAAATGSGDRVVVAADKNWRGKSISEIAEANARKVRRLLDDEDSPGAKVARLNLMGVSALNRNDRADARKHFQEANKIAPTDAFTLNNMGYVAELDGDRESAEFYYAKAREAERANLPVGVATRSDVEGQRLQQVALGNRNDVDSVMQQALQQRRMSAQPVLLLHRDKSPVVEPAHPPAPAPPEESEPMAQPGGEAQPATEQPAVSAPAQPQPEQPAANAPAGSNVPGSNVPGTTGNSAPVVAQPPQPSQPATQTPAAAQPQQPAAQAPVSAPAEEGPPSKVVVPYDAPVAPNTPPPPPK